MVVEPGVTPEGVTKRFGDFTAVDAIDLDDRRGRVLHAARPERLRQDDDAAHDRRVRATRRRSDPDRRRRRRRPARPQATDQHGLPELRAVPAPERQARTSPTGSSARASTRPRAEQRVQAELERVGLWGEANRRPEPALRRPAAARRARPRRGQPAEGAAARRAARRARPEAPQGPADRAQADPAGDRDHVRLRHPRPGGGADDVRPDRGHEPRRGRAGRDPRGGLRAARDDVRRRVHRRLEPDARRRPLAERREAPWSSSTPASPSRRRPTASRPASSATRSSVPRSSTSPPKGAGRGPRRAQRAERRGHRRELGLPRHRDPARRRAARRRRG